MGQAVGLVGQAVGLVGQAVDLVEQAVDLVEQPVGLVRQAVGLVGQAVGLGIWNHLSRVHLQRHAGVAAEDIHHFDADRALAGLGIDVAGVAHGF